MIKFRLRDGLGQSAIREMGSYLRLHGSGHHWVERIRGEVFIHPGAGPDERILLDAFSQLVEPIQDDEEG